MNYKQWLSNIEEIGEKEGPESSRGYVIESLRSKERLGWFGRYFFPHVIKGGEEVPEAHLDLIREINRRADGAIIFPRSFAKSTWIKMDTLHDIVYALEPVILYICNTFDDAAKHFEAMKNELENNDLLIFIYGDLVPSETEIWRKWTNKHFETINKINVVAKGAGKGRGVNIRHQRPTKIIIDDGEDDEMVESKDRRMKFERWISNVILPSKDSERGYVKMIGTVLSPHCQILKFYKHHGGIFRKAIEDDKSIWQWMWSIEKLMKKKEEIGSRAFAQEFLNTPISDETALIKPDWIKYYSMLDEKRKTYLTIMFDPQSGESKDADFYGLCVCGKYDKDKYKYVMSIKTGKGSKLEQAALFVRTYQELKKNINFEIMNAGIEVVMGQVAVYQLVLDWKAGKINLPDVNNDNRNIKVIKVDPEKRTKVDRLEDHEADFERGEVLFHESMRDFTEKLTCFPEVEHDDDIDALIYALTYLHKENLTLRVQSEDNTSRTVMGNIDKEQF